MVDTRTPKQRRAIMRSVGTKDTGPEIAVRKLLHKLGYRFRLHRKDLPGRPDIVLPARKKAIFVHGCFWHGHGCLKGRPPKSRLDYWLPKLAANRARDIATLTALKECGWTAMIVWQCEIQDLTALSEKLRKFLENPRELRINKNGKAHRY